MITTLVQIIVHKIVSIHLAITTRFVLDTKKGESTTSVKPFIVKYNLIWNL
jgi:hypothetical protein